MKRFLLLGVAAIAATVPLASGVPSGAAEEGGPTLVDAVREATQDYRDPAQAIAAGYVSTGSCVSGAQEGAMGVHYANPALIDDPAVDPYRPELLVYEPRNGRLRLAGVEYLVVAEAWNNDPEAENPAGAPVVLGQHFQFVGSPNRYGLPAFYELHVWAWKPNPLGMFADFNANISCEQYVGDVGDAAAGHAGHG